MMSKYDGIVIIGDFNLEPSTDHIETLCHSYVLHNLVKENTCLKGSPKCYHLILTNCKYNFQNTIALTAGCSDLHKMTVTILQSEYIKADPIQIQYRNYENFDPILFREELRNNQNNDIMSRNKKQ